MEFINYCIEETELKNLSDKQLSLLFIYVDRDRKDFDLKKLYWMIIKEINRRIEEEEKYEESIKFKTWNTN